MNAQDHAYLHNQSTASASPQVACEPMAPGLGALVNNSTGTASELFLISEEIINRLRGTPPAKSGDSATKPTSGPMKDGVEMTTDLMYSTLRNLRAIGEYLFA